MDGNYILIIAPEEHASGYFNWKGWHSIILQAVVDSKGLYVGDIQEVFMMPEYSNSQICGTGWEMDVSK